jgi:hypothetical protein
MSQSQPAASAPSAFPQAASANKSVFYKPDGTPKSVREVYDWALKLPSGGRAVDEQSSSSSLSSSPVVAGDESGFSNSEWTALQLYSATGGSSLGSLSSLSQAPFAVTADVVDLLGVLKAPAATAHGSHKLQ